MSLPTRERAQVIDELRRMNQASERLVSAIIRLERDTQGELNMLLSKASIPASHQKFQEQMTKQVQVIDALITDWDEATKPALEGAPLKSESLNPKGGM